MAKSKQEVKAAIKQATASGQAATKQQINALNKAGVNTANANKLINANQAAVQAATLKTNAATSQQQMQTTNPNLDTALRDRANQGLTIGQQYFDSPEGKAATNGMSPADVAKYAMDQGFGLGEEWAKQYGVTNTGKMKLSDAKNLAQGLRIAGARGKSPNLVSKKELNYLTKQFDKSGLNILGQMDKLNEKAATKGVSPLGIKSNLYNKIDSGKYGNATQPFGSNKFQGPLAQNLFAMRSTQTPWIKGQGGQVTPGAGKMPKGFGVYGRYNDQPIFSGGVGKNWSDTKFGQDQKTEYKPWYEPQKVDPKPDPDPTVINQQPVDQTVTPVTSEDPKMPLGPGGLTGGGAAFSGAAGLQRKKSYLRSLGIRGLGQLGRDQIRNMYKQTVNINR